MEIQGKHITLANFLEFFKPEADTTPNSKIILTNYEFMIIASLLKIGGYMNGK